MSSLESLKNRIENANALGRGNLEAQGVSTTGNETTYQIMKKIGDITGSGSPSIVKVQSDWEQTDLNESDYIKNKPFYKVEDYTYAGKDVECQIEGYEHHSAGYLSTPQIFDYYVFDVEEGKKYTIEIVDEDRLGTPTVYTNIEVKDYQAVLRTDFPVIGWYYVIENKRANSFLYFKDCVVEDEKFVYREGSSVYTFAILDKNDEYLTDGTVKVSVYEDFKGFTATKKYLPYLQPNWNENNNNSLSYVQNRTHWKEEVFSNDTTLSYAEPDPDFGMAFYGRKLGLEIGKTYAVDGYLADGSFGGTLNVTVVELMSALGVPNVPCISNNYATIYDGVDIDPTTGKAIYGDNCAYVFKTETFSKFIIRDLPSVETVVHKIPDEYLPKADIDQTYNPTSKNAQSGVAVEEALSGVNGIKYITEQVFAEDLDYGIYIIDEENGGMVEFDDFRFNDIFGLNYITSGTLIVTPYLVTDKMFTVFTNDANYYPLILHSVYSGGEWLFDDFTYTYANTKYVDEQIDELRDLIGGIENGSY